MPVMGVVENMNGFVCPTCGEKVDIFRSGAGQRMAEEAGVPFLGAIPIDPEVGLASDKGLPFILHHSDSPAGKAFLEIVKKVEDLLKEKEPTKS
jgi:ATP-binding protein involved in chromosome partitioning